MVEVLKVQRVSTEQEEKGLQKVTTDHLSYVLISCQSAEQTIFAGCSSKWRQKGVKFSDLKGRHKIIWSLA